jgi:hypothetical protein
MSHLLHMAQLFVTAALILGCLLATRLILDALQRVQVADQIGLDVGLLTQQLSQALLGGGQVAFLGFGLAALRRLHRGALRLHRFLAELGSVAAELANLLCSAAICF